MEVSMEEIQDQMLVNLRGPYLLNLGFFELLRLSGSGSVVMLTSEAGFEGKPNLTTYAMDRYFEDPANKARVLGRIPLGRLGEPHSDIGPVVRFLLADEARFVTGQTIMVDGGSCPIN